MKVILVKYGELTTKKGNRKEFVALLKKNIIKKLENYDYEIKNDLSKMYIITKENEEEIVEKLNEVFGIYKIVFAERVTKDIEEIKRKVIELLKQEKFTTFKINTKRNDKTFPLDSNEINNILGELVLNNFTCTVDVHNPDIIVNVEIRSDGVFIYTKEIKALGGYPVGIQGKGLLMLSGGIDSPVAGYLSLKRGINIECIYFESPPYTSLEARNKVLKLARTLNKYSGNIKVHVVKFTNIQEAIYKNIDHTYLITIMRRMMYRIAERVCQEKKIKAIINGESIGQVASQTLDSMSVINGAINTLVIRPVACFDKLEIIDLANKIETYETSILPFEDCCTIFVPKHPVINPVLSKCLNYEKLIDVEKLINDAVKNIETVTSLEKEFKEIL